MVLRRITALTRMLLGGGFLWMGVDKLRDSEFLYGGLMHRIRETGMPFPLYEQFLLRFVEIRQEQYAYASAIGEILVGVSLLLGLWVSFGSLAGAFLVMNFGLATTWNNPPMMAVHFLLAALLIVLGWRGASLTWGLDRRLANLINQRLLLFPWRPEIPVDPVKFVPLYPPGTRRPYISPPQKRG